MTTKTTKKLAPKKPAAKPKAGHVAKSGAGRLSATARRRIFAEEYIANGGIAGAAAIEAGYSPNTAHQIGYKLLKHPEVRAIIEARQAELQKKHELTTESVIAELAKIVHVDPRQFFAADGSFKPVSEWTDGMAGAVASLEIDELFDGQGKERKQIGYTKKLKFWCKNSALDKAMKHLGLFERDNEQKAGALAGLPPEILRAIVTRLKELKGARPRLAG